MKKIFGIVFVLIFSFLIIGSFSYKIEAAVDSLAIYPKVTPIITSFEPKSGKVGDEIVITGKNFERLYYVSFNGTNTFTTDFSGTRIVVKVPEGATNGKITVMNFSNLSTVSADSFTLDNPILGKPTINSFPLVDSVKLVASGNITPGDYHFGVYEEAGYPKNRADFKPAADQVTSTITGSFASIQVTISGLKPSTRYVGVLYKDEKYTDISEVHFATLFDTKITLGMKDITSTSITLLTLGILDKDLYHFYIYDNATSLQKPLFTKDISRTTESELEAIFSGLTPGHHYFGAIDFNMGIEYDTPVSPIEFTTLANGATPQPSTLTKDSIYKGGIVPECNTGDIDPTTKQYKNPCNFTFLMTLINNIIKFLLFTIATPLIALIVMYTGYLYITAGGDTGKTEKVRHILFNAVIGYVVALAAWLIVKTILSSLNVDPGIETFLK